jgi:SagB-type dehydrogenase family enzyme
MKKQYFGIAILVCMFLFSQGGAMASENMIKLPKPVTKGKISLEEAIAKRRSQRNFVNKDLTLEQISQLLWSAQGITGKKGSFSFRAAPSASALYPMEIYLVTKDGLFHYLVQEHGLEQLAKDDMRNALAEAAFGQGSVSQAGANIVICAVYSRITLKYGERGIRYVHIEAGHIAQNIHLEAVALGLGSVPVGAFDDNQVKKVLSLPKDEEPLYIIPVGYPE